MSKHSTSAILWHIAGKDHQPGANDSLIKHSLFGRIMGNTVRMRPRDADGITIGDDRTPQRSTAQQTAAWNDVWSTEAAVDTQERLKSKISIKARASPTKLDFPESFAGLQSY